MVSDFLDLSAGAKRMYDRTLEPVCGQYGLSRMELDILLFLANNQGYDTATDIVERRRLTKSHVSVSLAGLERRGYLARSFQSGNRKTAHLSLLPAAEAIVTAGQLAQRDFFAALLAGFTAGEREQMEASFARIVQNIRTALEKR